MFSLMLLAALFYYSDEDGEPYSATAIYILSVDVWTLYFIDKIFF